MITLQIYCQEYNQRSMDFKLLGNVFFISLFIVAIILFISQNDAADTAATGKQLQSDVFFDEGRSYFED